MVGGGPGGIDDGGEARVSLQVNNGRDSSQNCCFDLLRHKEGWKGDAKKMGD